MSNFLLTYINVLCCTLYSTGCNFSYL